jgi:hypothetical protein
MKLVLAPFCSSDPDMMALIPLLEQVHIGLQYSNIGICPTEKVINAITGPVSFLIHS